MGNDFLESFKRCPFTQRWNVKHRQQADMVRTVNFIKWQIFNQFIFRPGSMHKADRMLVRVDGIEGHFDFCSHHAGVYLGNQAPAYPVGRPGYVPGSIPAHPPGSGAGMDPDQARQKQARGRKVRSQFLPADRQSGHAARSPGRWLPPETDHLARHRPPLPAAAPVPELFRQWRHIHHRKSRCYHTNHRKNEL